MSFLTRGSVDADYPYSVGYIIHLYHFHHPWTHRGYAGWCRSAAPTLEAITSDALSLWLGGRREAAVYEIGRASHILADLWIPQHAAGVAGCGHGPYETWLAEDDRWLDYVPSSGGVYEWRALYEHPEGGARHELDSNRIRDWADLAAHESFAWYEAGLDACAHPDFRDFFPAAAASLVPGAVRYLAGYLNLFFVAAGAGEEGE